MKFVGPNQELLHLATIDHTSCTVLKEKPASSLTILWFQSADNQLVIDGKRERFSKNDLVFLTEFHQVTPKKIGDIRFLRFNRAFYCILDHDGEVGCKGILFFGAAQLPRIQIPAEELEKMEVLWKMFRIEMKSNDELQIEMLQMMLKRYLILCTRLYKAQHQYPPNQPDSDLLRSFNFLVEQHFRTKHSVAEYAELLHKSPKTLSNLFAKLDAKSPLQYIQDRRRLEAERLLRYTDRQIQEIAFELGFEDLQTFSRFFKKYAGSSPSKFRKQQA